MSTIKRLGASVLALALLACSAPASAGFTAPVAAFKPGGALGPVAANAAWEVPNTSTTGANAAAYWRTIYLPSDVVGANGYVSVTLANRLYNGATGSPITLPQIAAGTSDGAGGFASAPTIYTSQIVPGDGTVLTIPTTAITRGVDGSMVFAFEYPGGGGVTPVAYVANMYVGNYVVNGHTLYPTPAFGGQDSNPLFQIFIGYTSSRPHYLVLGDSISVGASTSPFNAGYACAAWPKLGADHDLAVALDGLPGGELIEFADPITYPYLWDQIQLPGMNVAIQLGTNDTSFRSAAQMLADFETIATYVRARGAASVIATTIIPTSAYGGAATAIRNTYNGILLSAGSSADLVCDIRSAVWNPANHDELDPADDSGDNLHPNCVGNANIEAALETCLGLSVFPWQCGQPIAPLPVVGLLSLVVLLAALRRKRRRTS